MTLQARTKRYLVAALLAAGWSVGTPALAQQDSKWYVGGSVGLSQFDVDTSPVAALGGSGLTTEDSDTGFKIFGGYQFTRIWGIEVGYVEFGKTEVRGTAGGAPFNTSIDVTAFTVAGTGTLPLNPNFSVFGKAGLYMWDSKPSSSGSIVAVGNDGTDLMLGAGVLYNISKSLAIQGEIEHFGGDDTITMFSVGLRFKF